MATQPAQRKSAPAAATAQADDFYGERNTGIRLVSTGKIDEEAEAARKSLIRSMGKKPKNSVTDRWQPKEEPTQLDKLAESGKMVNSHTEYERRRNSRIEARKAEFDKLRREREKAEQDRLERIQRRRSERVSQSDSSALTNGVGKLSLGGDKETSTSLPATRQSEPATRFPAQAPPRLSHR